MGPNICLLFTLVIISVSCSKAYVNVIATPVVYTNGNGGGVDELEVPATSESSKLFQAGGEVRSAWWVPYDNIKDLSAIHRIDVAPSGNHVNLIVHGLSNQRTGRVRIKILADVD